VKTENKTVATRAEQWSPFENSRREGLQVAPAVDVVDKDKEYEIAAELPGMDDKNIEVRLSNGS
jgi:HSP20 family protein